MENLNQKRIKKQNKTKKTKPHPKISELYSVCM